MQSSERTLFVEFMGSFTVLKREIDENKFNEENANFCIQFVIECAISLQKIKF